MAKKMKVLFVTNGYPTEKNPEYCVFTKEQVESVTASEEISGEIIFINAREEGLSAYLKAIPILRKKLKKVDLVHTFHGLSFLLVFLLAPSKKTIVSFLNNIENEYGEKKFLSKPLAYITKRIIRRSNIYKIFKDKIPSDIKTNSFYLPNGVDTKKFFPMDQNEAKKRLGLAFDKKYILFVSSKNQYRPQKRYDRFKAVIERLEEKFLKIEELVLVNEPRDKIIYYFNAANLHLLTSDFEGSPNSVKEALACNTPVVATASGNVEEMLNGLPGCYVSKDYSVEELANYAEKVLRNSSQINLHEYIKLKNLDMEGKAKELVDIYKHVMKQ